MSTMIQTQYASNKAPSPIANSAAHIENRKRTKYHKLDFEGDECDQVNVYGVVVDASYPSNTKDKWICSLKVVDVSLHTTDDEDLEKQKHFEHAIIVVYAKRFEDCPIVRQIGDVIRVHRANVKEYRGRKQFNVNVHYNSSWCLFGTKPEHAMVKDQESSCDEEMPVDEKANGEDVVKIGNSEYEPYKFSGKNYSLDMVAHKPLLRGLRKWALNYMGTNQCIQLNQYTQLEKLNEQERGRDIDLLVKVLKVSEKDEQTLELRIKDNTNILWFLMLPKLKFGGIINIRPGEIVRVRSVVKEVTTRRNVITAKATTNILKFVENAKVIRTMTERIEELKDTEKILLEDDSEVIMQQVAMTEIISTNPEMEQEKIFKL